MHDLKPCPFCGEKPEVNKHFNEVMGHSIVHRCKLVGAIMLDWSKLENIIARWNTRANLNE